MPRADGSVPEPSVRRRGVAAAICVAIGYAIVFHAPVHASHIWLIVGGASALGALLLRGVACRAAIAIALIAAGAGWFTLRVHEAPPDHIGRAISRDAPVLLSVEGVIEETPKIRDSPPGYFGEFLRFAPYTKTTLRATARETTGGSWTGASGRLALVIGGRADELRAGDRVRVLGMAEAFDEPRNPGERDYRPTATQRRLAGLLRAHAGSVRTIAARDASLADSARAQLLRIAAGARARAARALPEEETDAAAAMRAMLLGERTDPLANIRSEFSRAGVAHMLAISGLHLGILTWVGLLALRAAGERPRLETTLLLGALCGYLVIVPAETPVVRASIMIAAFVLAESAERRYDRLNLLAWVGVIVLLWRPLEIVSPGFHLSFGVVAALLAFARPTRDRLFGAPSDPDMRTALGHARLWLADALAAGLVAWIVSAPIIAFHFGMFSPLGWIATVILTPLFALGLIVGYASLLISLVAPGIGEAIAPLLALLGEWIVGLVRIIDGTGVAAVHLPRLSAPWAIAALLVACAWLHRPRLRNMRLLGATAALIAWSTALLTARPLPAETLLRIDTFDVGQGTCHLVRSGEDAILWDCGSRDLTIGQWTLPRAIRALGAARIPTVVLSHANIDHYSALPDLATPFGVRRVLLGDAFRAAANADPTGPEAHLLDALESQGVAIEAIASGKTFSLGEAEVEFLAPRAGRVFRETNDTSLVARFSVQTDRGERRLLLCGDIQRDAIAALLETEADLRADIVEAPHHGSAIPASFAFVEAVDPALVIQSTDASRLLDERWAEVRDGRTWLSTTRVGAIAAEIRADGSIATDSILAGPALVRSR